MSVAVSNDDGSAAGIYEEIQEECIEMQGNKCYQLTLDSKDQESRSASVETSLKKKILFLVIATSIAVVLFFATCACCTLAFVEISRLKSEMSPLTSCLKDSIVDCEEIQLMLNSSVDGSYNTNAS